MSDTQQSQKFPDCFYRVTIKGMCVRDGKLLMIKESQSLSGGKWELPGGGLDFGNGIREDFAREVEEEMGLKVTKMSELPMYVWTWKYENRRNLNWFHVCVLTYCVEFEDLNIRPSEECEEISFFSEGEIRSMGLSGQMTPLSEHFKAKDFEAPF